MTSPVAFELLELLAQTERSVEELAGLSGLTIANASQHLQHLRIAVGEGATFPKTAPV